MKIKRLHDWNVTTAEARDIQGRLAERITTTPLTKSPKLIAGIDISVSRWHKAGRAAVVVLDYPSLEPLEIQVAESVISFPYVPGLLSFREAPLAIEACRKLTCEPDLVIVDAQGIAHPRRLGFASHLGLCLDVPTIGCAKSRLIGSHADVPNHPGGYAYLYDGDEIIGASVRTKPGVKPVYVSQGHMIDLTSAIKWVIQCCKGYRLPQPTRLAHLAANGILNNAPVNRYIKQDTSEK